MQNAEKGLDVVECLEIDDFFRAFLNAEASNELLKCLTVGEQVKKLGEGIEAVSRVLHEQVLNKHSDLVRQASHVTKLEQLLETMRIHTHILFANAERLKAQIAGPYEALERHTTVLSRLHLASHILRQVNRIQNLNKRLATVGDVAQKATLLRELEQLTADFDWSDIDAIAGEIRSAREQRQRLVKYAFGQLTQGIIDENSNQTRTALQIFVNLDTIKNATDDVVDDALKNCQEVLASAFDTSGSAIAQKKTSGGPGRANLTTSQGFRNKIWDDLEKIFNEELYYQAKRIKFLREILNALKDSSSGDIAADFWKQLGRMFVDKVQNSTSSITQMMELEYPKLLKIYRDFAFKLNYAPFNYDRGILENCENTYLAASLNRLLEPTQTMFTPDTVPSQAKTDLVIRNVTNEFSLALVEECLCEKVAKNVSKCVKMYAVKTEQQIITGPEASQIIAGAANSSQKLNVKLANAAYYFHAQVKRILVNMRDTLSSTAINTVEDSLEGLNNLTESILQPLIDSTNSVVETIIITIHIEQDWAKLQTVSNRSSIACSPYMRELIQFLTRVHRIYFQPFENKQVLFLKCKDIITRCIELLVRHSALLRPLSQGGRQRLQIDYQQFETCLKALYPYLADLGRPYRIFKSMSTLVTLLPGEIVERQKSGSSVPHSVVLLLLFSFGGADLASPHQNTGWSLNKLSSWLDRFTAEKDRLDLIAGALQRYENLIRQTNLSNYDPVYPIMSGFLAYATEETAKD